MASIKTRGIILRRRAYGEADRILTLLTPGMGKITVIAKGSRRLHSKLSGYLELFYVVDWVLAEGRTWYVVTGAEIVAPYRTKNVSLEWVEQASYLARLVDRCTPEQESQPKIYDLLVEALPALSGENIAVTLRQFEWQVLLALGLQPELRLCSHCRGILDPKHLGLCASRGGALCVACLQTEVLHVPVQEETLKILRLFERAPSSLASRLHVDSSIAAELTRVTRVFLEHALEAPLAWPSTSATLTQAMTTHLQ